MTPGEYAIYLQGLQDGIKVGYASRGRQAVDPKIRFWAKVNKTDACWLWTGALTWDGYGIFRPDAKRQGRAHTFSYELHHAPIPAGMVVRHSCDMPACVRPDHLLVGTHADNVRDKVERGRARNGSTGKL